MQTAKVTEIEKKPRKRLNCIWCGSDFAPEQVKGDVCPKCGKSGLMEEEA